MSKFLAVFLAGIFAVAVNGNAFAATIDAEKAAHVDSLVTEIKDALELLPHDSSFCAKADFEKIGSDVNGSIDYLASVGDDNSFRLADQLGKGAELLRKVCSKA